MARIFSRSRSGRAGALALALAAPTWAASVTALEWSELPPLPPSAGRKTQPGVAGPFAGVHREALIVAGGANFPDRMPWDGGTKVWWDDIWVLERRAGAEPRWVTDKRFRLPRPLAYGFSVSTPQGVICAGGHDAERCYADVFLLSWDAATREVHTKPLPPLPEPLSFMAGALVGRTLYVAGGQHVMKGAVPSSAFWALDLKALDGTGAGGWRRLPTWPGPPRILPVAAAARVGEHDVFLLFSGRIQQAGRRTTVLTDAYAFDPARDTWRTLSPVGGDKGTSVMAGTAAPVGGGEVLVFAGDRGELFLELETHDLAIEELRRQAATAGASKRPELERAIDERLAAKRKIYDEHPGFNREVLLYDARRDTWRTIARAPVLPQVTTLAVIDGDGAIIIPSGEIRPGVRTPAVVRVVPRRRE